MAADTASRPNVVLVIMDTLRADKMGCYGFPLETSPELDAIAKGGVRFARAISQCSWTRPSIGSMLTGLYPRRLGLYDERNEKLADRFTSLAETFRANGYAAVGATANPNINRSFGFAQGFESYRDSDKIWPWMRRRKGEDLARRGTLASDLEIFEEAVRAARAAARPPYYVQVNVMELHTYGAPVRPEHRSAFEGKRNQRYLRALRQLSRDIPPFLERLAAEVPGWGDDTLLAIASDHGEGLDDHPGIRGAHAHGNVLYESQLWVPMILHRTGGGLAPAVVERPVRVMDLFPTVLEIAGIDVPSGIDGVSLVPLIRNPSADVGLPERFVSETYFMEAEKISVYETDWKYFENRDDWPRMNPRELQARGGRERGAATDRISERPEVAAPMDDFLEAWEARHARAAPTPVADRLGAKETAQLEALGYLD